MRRQIKRSIPTALGDGSKYLYLGIWLDFLIVDVVHVVAGASNIIGVR